ncbi:MAG: hypothetical protein A2015_01345 [Spirochaetes bacterium GWF1_31_7]|nr:MAG: hypothetical protein A2Y30_07935 [Spirochaetes bacterium GWE1_32_154]OHD47838.1 MAG: hypothetical protein A2015_01345 [Spirochaetes bacterium GWF1_31_7]OHD52200.1 MAG: hypothetical protein A2Y29_17580 [Spirochaetes bacterium GWE2_31_10]OHD79333.1 MAG: hypothetical protein A2355_03985 [Spirochaetes bacterium RIFOXYB1_FULL_32_8]
MKLYIKRLKAISDLTRVRIIKTLIKSKLELCVCEIVDALQLPFYTVSKQIKELNNADILDENKQGKFVMYSIKKNPDDVFLNELISLINLIPDDLLNEDFENLRKRLILRENGKCVIGATEINS